MHLTLEVLEEVTPELLVETRPYEGMGSHAEALLRSFYSTAQESIIESEAHREQLADSDARGSMYALHPPW